MALELELRSLAGNRSAFFQWPLPPLNDETEPTNEVIETIRLVCEEEAREFPQLRLDLDNILRDYDTKSYQNMKQVCDRYNQIVEEIVQKDIGRSSEQRLRRRASVRLLRHIIQQCYNRAVVDPEKLNQYEPFSAGVYGETSFELIDQMINTINFTESDQFIDLGSGVGQVVLQVAAATNCKSCYGIEKANWPAQYAEQMAYEFRRWMEFYGKTYSNFELIKGDFLAEGHRPTINASTVIFVNNFAFGPGVDHQLKERFHELREGTKIVSSKEFRPFNMQISERNLSDIGAIMTVQMLSPLRGPVSWTYKPVAYFLHTIDSNQLVNYFKDRQEGHRSCGRHRKERNQRTTHMRSKKDNEVDNIQSPKQKGTNHKRKLLQRLRIPSHNGELVSPDSNLERVPQTPIRLIAKLQMSENLDEERNSSRNVRAARSLQFGPENRNRFHLPSEKPNNRILNDRLERHIQKLKLSMGFPNNCNDELLDHNPYHVSSRRKLVNGEMEGKMQEGKRKRTASGLPESKRARIILFDDEELRTDVSVKQAKKRRTVSDVSPVGLTDARKPKDVTNFNKQRNASGKPDMQHSRLASEGVLRERKMPDVSLRNVEEKKPKLKLLDIDGVRRKNASSRVTDIEKYREILKISNANQKIASEMSGEKLQQALSYMSDDRQQHRADSGQPDGKRQRTLSEILNQVGEEENLCVRKTTAVSLDGDVPNRKLRRAATGDEQLTPKSSNRWLFDIRLSSSPITQVEGHSSTADSAPVTLKPISRLAVKSEDDLCTENSSSLDNVSREESVLGGRIETRSNSKRIQLVTHPAVKRIQFRSHPSHAGRGFATPRRRCISRIDSDESLSEEPLDVNDESQCSDGSSNNRDEEMDENAGNSQSFCREPKVEKEASDDELGDDCQLGSNEADKSLRGPCWSDTEFDDAELDDALNDFYEEANRVTETGYTDTVKFDVDWMRLESEKMLSKAVPLPETEPISGSSDFTDPPTFFPHVNTDGVAAWLLTQRRNIPDYDYKTEDWFPGFHSQQQGTSSVHPPIYVSLPREAIRPDFSTICHTSVSSIPISLPREAALLGSLLSNGTKSYFSPHSQSSSGSVCDFKPPCALKLDHSPKSEHDSDFEHGLESSRLNQESSQVDVDLSHFGHSSKSCHHSSKSQFSPALCSGSSGDAIVPLTSTESLPWDASGAPLPSIPVSLPKAGLTTCHGEWNNGISGHDGASCAAALCTKRCCSSADDRSCTSFSGSTLSYGNPFPVEGQRPDSGEGWPRFGNGGQASGNHPESSDEAEVPAALLQLLDSFKSQYTSLLKHLKSPSYRLELLSQIQDEQDRKATDLSRIEELSQEIARLESESVNLLRTRSAEIGIEASNREEFFGEANRLVLRNKSLQLQAIHLHHQVAVEQEKLFQKYLEFCYDETMVSLWQRNLPPVSMTPTEHLTPDQNSSSTSVSALSSTSSPRSLDQALITSDLSLSIVDQPVTVDRIEELGDPLEMINLMPKLNKSVDYCQDGPAAATGDTKALSRTGSPELDMPLLMPELDPTPVKEPSDAEKVIPCCVTMSIPVKLPLRKLMRQKKPPGLSVVIPNSDAPTSEALARSGNDTAGNLAASPIVASPLPPKPATLADDRMNMYSPISQASNTENFPSIDDCTEEKVNNVMQCFSPISSPGSSRSAASEHLGHPSDVNGFLLPITEASFLQTLPLGYQATNFNSWELCPGGLEHPDITYPWTSSQLLGLASGLPDPVNEDDQLMIKEPSTSQKKQRKKSSPRQRGGSHSNVTKRTFVEEEPSNPDASGAVRNMATLDSYVDCFPSESSETPMPRASCRGPRKSDGEVRHVPSLTERSTSVPLENRTGRQVTAENLATRGLHNVVAQQKDDEATYQDGYSNNEMRLSCSGSTARIFTEVPAAVCKPLTQNSPRQLAPDPMRQLESRSDSRDSGLGKESEVDYDRGLMSRNNVALRGGALDSGLSCPRTISHRSPRSSQLHPVTPLTLSIPGSSFPWQPNFPSQLDNSSDAYESKTFRKKRFSPVGFVGCGFQDHIRLSPSVYADDRRPRSTKSTSFSQPSTGFNQLNGCRPSTGLSRLQRRVFEVSACNNDLSRTIFCGNENSGNFRLPTPSADDALPTHWGTSQAAILSPTTTSQTTQGGSFRVTDHVPPNGTRLSSFDYFPNRKALDSKWPSFAADTSKLLEREYSNHVHRVTAASNSVRQNRLRTPSPVPNSQFELHPGFPSAFPNHLLCNLPTNSRFSAYPPHMFGGAPSFQSISSNSFMKDRRAASDYHQSRVSAQKYGYCTTMEQPFCQQSKGGCDKARLRSHLNPHRP